MEVRLEPCPVRGFRFAGVSAGLKHEPGRKDLGLIVADNIATAGAVFTTSQIRAAPVSLAQRRLGLGKLRAVVANSGSANCFTGRAGMKLALDSCEAVARAISCPAKYVVPCSTGVIGHLFDFDKFSQGVQSAVIELATDGLRSFAESIMTTDTVPKVVSTTLNLGGVLVTIAGAAKGAGMISPKMATLLAFMMTDAAVPGTHLKQALSKGLLESFNAITVDGDMSTNDTLILMASGAAGNSLFTGRDRASFETAVAEVARALARELVRDGEGATKLVTVEVRGARRSSDAERIARQIANSPLVKTAFFGCDPNVGRILMAAAAPGVPLDPNRIQLWIDEIKIAERGMIILGALEGAAATMRGREFSVRLDLRMGKASARVMTSDLSLDYVRINAEYTT